MMLQDCKQLNIANNLAADASITCCARASEKLHLVAAKLCFSNRPISVAVNL